MGIFRSQKLPLEDLSLSFGAVAFPIHVWAIINILMLFPAWLLRMTVWELAGGVGYALAAALLESCTLWLILVSLGLLLPGRWLADQFAAASSVIAWLLAGWAALVQFNFDQILRWEAGSIAAGLLTVALSAALAAWLVRRYGGVERLIRKAAQGLAVLAYLYVSIDVLGLAVVVLRNL